MKGGMSYVAFCAAKGHERERKRRQTEGRKAAYRNMADKAINTL